MPTKKSKIIFYALLIVDIFVAACFVLVLNSMNNLIANTILNEDQIIIESQKTAAEVSMKKDVDNTSSDRDKLSDYFIKSDGPVDFIKSIETLSSKNNLKDEIKSISYSDFPNNPDMQFLNLSISVTGEWSNVELFLEFLENYPIKININKVSFSKFADYQIKGKQVPQWLGSFDISVAKFK